MAIKIETRKFWDGDRKCREILSVNALYPSQLPHKYTVGYPQCYGLIRYIKDVKDVKHCLRIREHVMHHTDLYRGKVISEPTFQELLSVLNRCGDRLQKINRKLRDEWSGTETITI